MTSTSHFILVTLSLSALAVTAARADLIEPVSQDRSIVGTAYASDDFDFFDDAASDAAPDFGPFDSGVAASVDTEGSVGSGGGSQVSQILADRLIATGSMFATGECWEFGFTAGGTSTNRFDVTFDLTADADYALTGTLGRFDRGNTTLHLEGPGGSVHEVLIAPNSLEPISFSGSLPTGQYRLSITSSGSADGYDFDSDYASGEFDVTLEFQTAAFLPETGMMTSSLLAYPNPFRTDATIAFSPSASTTTEIRILDTTGRVLRVLRGAPSLGSVLWNGRDDSGEEVAAGVYFVRMEQGAAGGVGTRKLLRVE